MKRPRPSYKAKWQDARAEAREQRDRAGVLLQELTRLKSVLAVEGDRVLRAFHPKETGPIDLPNLAYECVTASIETNGRYCRDWALDLSLGDQRYAWRGRPIRREEP